MWDTIIVEPMLNILIVFSRYLFSSLGLTIIALTIVIRGLMYPLMVKQLRATKAMRDLQPKIAELKKKYAKDKQKLGQEQMKLYKASGMSPAGCIVPLLIQMPIWIALYQSIMKVLAETPEGFLNLSQHLYSWPVVNAMLPLGNKFLWLNLATPDSYLLLPILVGGTMWLQQKMITPTTTDPKQQTQGRMMLWMLPLMFAFLTLTFPSGLALYWVTSNVITIVMQYFVTGWGGLTELVDKVQSIRGKRVKKPVVVEEAPLPEAEVVESSSEGEEGSDYGELGDKRQDRGRSYPKRLRATKRRPRKGKSHRPKKR